MRARAIAEPVSTVLSRSEMAFVGVPEKEMVFVRNWAREALPMGYWLERDLLERQRMLFEHMHAYVCTVAKLGDKAKAATFERSLVDAHENWKRAEQRLRSRQVRRLPKLPDPRATGATPTDGEEEVVPRPGRRRDPEREMIEREHRGERPTGEGEDAWNSRWGDPDAELPAPMPQGMKRLPSSEPVQIPPRQPRPQSGPKGRAPKSGPARPG